MTLKEEYRKKDHQKLKLQHIVHGRRMLNHQVGLVVLVGGHQQIYTHTEKLFLEEVDDTTKEEDE